MVGIGASAGGLRALQALLASVPWDHLAFVVVQHLKPDHTSLLPELLSRCSTLHVVVAEDGMALRSNTVFVIPASTHAEIRGGILRQVPRQPARKRHMPIDLLFRSLAEDAGFHAIGVVLSGLGSDGTQGLRAIKAAGGLTYAQDPATADFADMPKHALAEGCADYMLSPEAIGGELAALRQKVGSYHGSRAAHTGENEELSAPDMMPLHAAMREEYGADFTHYKPGTIERRVRRRMLLKDIDSLQEYLDSLQSDLPEVRRLYQDLLITVTQFFRDPEAFHHLRQKVLPEIVRSLPQAEPLRLWVPACATGEEAYSAAICVDEVVQAEQSPRRVQIFATDLDSDAIRVARQGIYPQAIEADVSAERLRRFFQHSGEQYQVCRRLRGLVVFSQQNLLQDAPFSRMNLVCCRNLLIYLRPVAQQKVLKIFSYALKPDGLLMLGASEAASAAPNLFATTERNQKIYRKKPARSPSAVALPPMAEVSPSPAARLGSPPRPAGSLQAAADRTVLECYAPPGAVVNASLDVVSLRGETGPYLAPTSGLVSPNLLGLARADLRLEIKRATDLAMSSRCRTQAEAGLEQDGAPHRVQIDVLPFVEPVNRDRCLVVLFAPAPHSAGPAAAVAGPTADAEWARPDEAGELPRRAKELEHELRATKNFLRAKIEEQEVANEAFKSANEELQSANEELQSTNEELETSKEEMHSANEELITVNDELQARMSELSQAHDDLHNLLVASDSVVVLVALDLTLRRFTHAAERVLGLTSSDVGRPVSILDQIGVGLGFGEKVASVIDSLSSYEVEVARGNKEPLVLRISPY